MKPDDKKHRDKARLDRKKEAGLAARTARKEARAVVDNPLHGEDAAALMETVRHQRGERRRHAFLALAELDVTAATNLVDGLIDDAQGKNREELGRLLLWRGGPRHVDAVLAGRAGDIVIAGFAPGEVVIAAAARLLPEVPRLAPAVVADRLRRLGVAPLVEVALEGVSARATIAALLVAALHHPRQEELSTPSRDAMIDALLRAAPDTLWSRCRDVVDAAAGHAGPRDPRLQLAALAAGVDVEDTAALTAWLQRLSPAERSQRLKDARLPESARRLGTDAAVDLWRLCVLDEAMPVSSRQSAARALWTRHGEGAANTLLLHPTVAIDVTVALSRVVGFEEFWDAVGPACASSTPLRDALLTTPVVRHPEVLDTMRAVLRTDPLGFAAFAVQSDAPQASDELLQGIDVAPADDVPWLLLGALTTTADLGPMRERPVLPQLQQLLARTEGGHDVVAGLQALRRALPRLPGLAVAIDAAIERIVRRYTLAR